MGNLNRLLNLSEINSVELIRETALRINQFDGIPSIVGHGLYACREWEYGWGVGNLLKMIGDRDLRTVKWLDIGSGNSILPLFLSSLGIQTSIYEFPESEKYFTENRFNLPVTFIPVKQYERSYGDAWNDLSYHIDAGDALFDVITCVSVLEHLPHHEEALLIREMARVLKPQAPLYITTDVAQKRNFDPNLRAGNNKWHIFSFGDLARDIIGPCIGCGLSPLEEIIYQPGLPENELEHTKLHNILSIFLRRS